MIKIFDTFLQSLFSVDEDSTQSPIATFKAGMGNEDSTQSLIATFTSVASLPSKELRELGTKEEFIRVARQQKNLVTKTVWTKEVAISFRKAMHAFQESTRIQIFIRFNKTILVTVDLNSTIAQLKQQIEDKEGIPLVTQRLYLHGKPLHDDYTLLEYNIQKENTIQLNTTARATTRTAKEKKRRVSDKQRDTCKNHLSEVAQTYMREFGEICNKLGLVNCDTGNIEFSIYELEDDKAKKLVKFVKRKMKLIVKNRMSMHQETGASGHSGHGGHSGYSGHSGHNSGSSSSLQND